jgi:hypothetical protein
MDIHQQIAELTAELRDTRLTKAERAAARQQLEELQHDLELADVEAVDRGDGATVAALFRQWTRIENALTA